VNRPNAYFRGRVVRKSSALACIRGRPDFLSAQAARAECHCARLKSVCKQLIINEILVEAAGVEPASENVTGQENYMLSRVHAPGITLGRSRPALRTDKKRVPLACDLNLPPQLSPERPARCVTSFGGPRAKPPRTAA